MLASMPRKPAPLPDDPEQSKRFIEAARAAGTDEDPEAFERAFERVVVRSRKPTTTPPRPKVK
jgi:hypothetical protein